MSSELTEPIENAADNEKRPQFGTRLLKDSADVYKHNAW